MHQTKSAPFMIKRKKKLSKLGIEGDILSLKINPLEKSATSYLLGKY